MADVGAGSTSVAETDAHFFSVETSTGASSGPVSKNNSPPLNPSRELFTREKKELARTFLTGRFRNPRKCVSLEDEPLQGQSTNARFTNRKRLHRASCALAVATVCISILACVSMWSNNKRYFSFKIRKGRAENSSLLANPIGVPTTPTPSLVTSKIPKNVKKIKGQTPSPSQDKPVEGMPANNGPLNPPGNKSFPKSSFRAQRPQNLRTRLCNATGIGQVNDNIPTIFQDKRTDPHKSNSKTNSANSSMVSDSKTKDSTNIFPVSQNVETYMPSAAKALSVDDKNMSASNSKAESTDLLNSPKNNNCPNSSPHSAARIGANSLCESNSMMTEKSSRSINLKGIQLQAVGEKVVQSKKNETLSLPSAKTKVENQYCDPDSPTALPSNGKVNDITTTILQRERTDPHKSDSKTNSANISMVADSKPKDLTNIFQVSQNVEPDRLAANTPSVDVKNMSASNSTAKSADLLNSLKNKNCRNSSPHSAAGIDATSPLESLSIVSVESRQAINPNESDSDGNILDDFTNSEENHSNRLISNDLKSSNQLQKEQVKVVSSENGETLSLSVAKMEVKNQSCNPAASPFNSEVNDITTTIFQGERTDPHKSDSGTNSAEKLMVADSKTKDSPNIFLVSQNAKTYIPSAANCEASHGPSAASSTDKHLAATLGSAMESKKSPIECNTNKTQLIFSEEKNEEAVIEKMPLLSVTAYNHEAKGEIWAGYKFGDDNRKFLKPIETSCSKAALGGTSLKTSGNCLVSGRTKHEEVNDKPSDIVPGSKLLKFPDTHYSKAVLGGTSLKTSGNYLSKLNLKKNEYKIIPGSSDDENEFMIVIKNMRAYLSYSFLKKYMEKPDAYTPSNDIAKYLSYLTDTLSQRQESRVQPALQAALNTPVEILWQSPELEILKANDKVYYISPHYSSTDQSCLKKFRHPEWAKYLVDESALDQEKRKNLALDLLDKSNVPHKRKCGLKSEITICKNFKDFEIVQLGDKFDIFYSHETFGWISIGMVANNTPKTKCTILCHPHFQEQEQNMMSEAIKRYLLDDLTPTN
eukprot:GHVT01076504.1.p1 GENE.GHVT01076504.1~~GHVT01076504.1.p1  ORF type:complete len:1140 (+),score=110.46 GHVT01076504.1:292-3420(+)